MLVSDEIFNLADFKPTTYILSWIENMKLLLTTHLLLLLCHIVCFSLTFFPFLVQMCSYILLRRLMKKIEMKLAARATVVHIRILLHHICAITYNTNIMHSDSHQTCWKKETIVSGCDGKWRRHCDWGTVYLKHRSEAHPDRTFLDSNV